MRRSNHFGVLREANRRGLRLPGDLAVVSICADGGQGSIVLLEAA